MTGKNEIPAGVQPVVQSVRWVIQSRADKTDPWYTENDSIPGLTGGYEDAARKLLRVYRTAHPHRESHLVRRTIACFDEPVEG